MTRLEWYQLESTRIGLELGTVKITDFAKYIRFSIYTEYLKKHDKTTAIQLAADECRCEQTTIYRAIDFFCNTMQKDEH